MGEQRTFEWSAFLRVLFLILSAVIFSALLSIPAFVSCFIDRSGEWPSFFQRLWVNMLLQANGIRLRVVGLENLSNKEAYILVSNHASILDIPAIISACPFSVRFLAKKSLIWFPIFGWFLYLAEHILIDRESASSALKSLKKAATILKKGISIIIFPEGTRTPDGQLKDFKRGAFLLAQHSKFPIVPISISGSFQMLPRHGWCFWPGAIYIYMDKPIPTQNLTPSEAKTLMDKVREVIIRNLPYEPE